MSSSTQQTRVFLSYARSDDEPFVRRLHADLAKAGFTVWFDRESLISRGLTFHQEIKDAIRTEVDRVVYVGGPKAAISPYVREEWKFALECDHVVVTPILRLGDYEHVPGELSLLHCEDFRDDTKYAAALARLVANLRQPNPKLGALFAVPSLPPNFLGRPDLMLRVRDALLVDLQKPQVITGADARVGMQGMGGIGKSVLAAALARNRQVRQSYPDGVVWIACGQNLTDDDLLKRQRDLARHLGGDDEFSSLDQGKGVLRQMLAAKAVLLVLDDVWRAADAQPFDMLGPRCRMLVTTRDKSILDTLHGELVPVSLFTGPEALQLLADAVNLAVAALPAEAHEVAHECGCLPLALALCGGMARSGHAWSEIAEALREADLEWPEDREAVEQHRTIWNTMKASFDALPDQEKPRFVELAVFGTDQTVPEAAAATLWEFTGQVSPRNTSKLLINLSKRSLIQLDLNTEDQGKVRRQFRLHDLLHDYAMRVAGERRSVHQNLLHAYRKKCHHGWPTGPNDGYFLQNLASHFANTEAWHEAEGLVTDFSWLMRKCELGLLDSISCDYTLLTKQVPDEVRKRLQTWQVFFREKAHILRRGNEDWPRDKILLQLAVEHADDSPLTIAAEKWLKDSHCDWFWLRRVPRLPHAQKNPCLAVLEGHTYTVNGARVLADRRLLSWSADKTLRLWDSNSACQVILQGHTDFVKGALELAKGRLLSWSSDKTLRVWDSRSGACQMTLQGHTDFVDGALELAKGRLLSWSSDKTLRLWDGYSGACLSVLEGHNDLIRGVLELPDGRLLSWSWDTTLRLWNHHSGICVTVLEGHISSVEKVLTLTNGRILFWGYADGTLGLWDISGQCLMLLKGHRAGYAVIGAFELADGRLVSWSADETLRIWDSETGVCLTTLKGHTDFVNGALELEDGRLLSWSTDNTLRLWESQNGTCLRTLEGHTGKVRGALVLGRERLVSWSADDTLRIWDCRSGDFLTILERHYPVLGALVIANGRLLTWSDSYFSADYALRLWDNESNVKPATLDGHTQPVRGALVLSDGRLLSWSMDGTLRLWDSESGTCLKTIKGHQHWVNGALALADGRLLSWSEDGSLRVWDGLNGVCLARLEGHTESVFGALEFPDGRVLSWSFHDPLRLWDSWSGECLDVIQECDVKRLRPKWAFARKAVTGPSNIAGKLDLVSLRCMVRLRHTESPSTIASWATDANAGSYCLLPDGTAVVGLASGQVCILKLYHGQRRISLAELEEILASQKRTAT